MPFVALRILITDRAKCVAIVIGLTFAGMIMAQLPAMLIGVMAQTHGGPCHVTRAW